MDRMKGGILFSESILNPVNPVNPVNAVRPFLVAAGRAVFFCGKKILSGKQNFPGWQCKKKKPVSYIADDPAG